MFRAAFVIGWGLLLVPEAALRANDDGKAGRITVSYLVEAKKGHGKQFEEAMSAHCAWAKENGETWSWLTWQYTTGERLGQYVIASFNHHWSDLDEHGEASAGTRAQFYEKVMPHVESISRSLWVAYPELGRKPSADEKYPLLAVMKVSVAVGERKALLELAGQVTAAVAKVDADRSPALWYERVAGGENGQFLVVFPKTSWADFERPEESLDEVMTKAVGEKGWAEIQSTWKSIVTRSEQEVLRLRLRLSLLHEAGEPATSAAAKTAAVSR